MKKLFIMGLLTASTLFNTALAEKKNITDVLGREVSVDIPLKRPVLAFYYTDFLAIGGEHAMDNVVGFSKDVWKVWTPANWDLFSNAMPQLKKITDVGEVETGTFSVEKVLSLKPDALILADWQYQALKADLTQIETANIPVIVLDYNKEKVDLHVKSTEIIGELTGQSERAKKLANNYRNIIENIEKTVKQSGKAKPKIYIEYGKGGPDANGTTYGSTMWGALATLAQGDNIAAPYVEKWGKMNPEQVITSKPDVIMISGRETELNKNKESMVMGIGIPRNEAQRRLAGFKARKGWQAIPAIKNNRIYGVYTGASRNLADAAVVQFMAKQLYPDLFANIKPEQTYLDFFKNYLPVVPEGTFMTGGKDAEK